MPLSCFYPNQQPATCSLRVRCSAIEPHQHFSVIVEKNFKYIFTAEGWGLYNKQAYKVNRAVLRAAERLTGMGEGLSWICAHCAISQLWPGN